VLLEGGDRAAAERVWAELKDLAERTRDATVRVSACDGDIRVALMDGRLEEAVGLARAAAALGAELGVGLVGGGLFVLLAQALICLGRNDEAAALPIVANPRGRGHFAVASSCLAHLGRHEEARAFRDRFGNLGAESDETASFMLALLLESAVLGGDADAARALERRLAAMARFSCVVYNGRSWARLLGGAAALLGERDKARAYYEQAIEQCTRIRNRPELALTHLELAELLLGGSASAGAEESPHPDPFPRGEGDATRAEALGHLDLAIAEFQEMKMQPALERALRHKDVLKA